MHECFTNPNCIFRSLATRTYISSMNGSLTAVEELALQGAVEEWALELGSNSYPRMPPASPGSHERLWVGLRWPAGLRWTRTAGWVSSERRSPKSGGLGEQRTAASISRKRQRRSPANGGLGEPWTAADFLRTAEISMPPVGKKEKTKTGKNWENKQGEKKAPLTLLVKVRYSVTFGWSRGTRSRGS